MNPKSLTKFIRIIASSVLTVFWAGVSIFPAFAASGGIYDTSSNASTFTQINFYANIETMGVVVKGSNLPKVAQLFYRRDGETEWRSGHPMMRIDSGRLVGSLFGLSPSLSYNVKVVDGSTEISGSATTQADELQFSPTTILHVDAAAPSGGNGSSASPFQTIKDAVSRARPGTQVLVADGVYHESISFPSSGTVNNWIQVKAEGKGAVLDGSDTLSGNIWKPYDAKGHIWVTKVNTSVSYLARDQQRYYLFESLSALVNKLGHNRVPMEEGWYMTPGSRQLYVRSLDDPSKHTWQVPRFNHAFDVKTRDWIWIEGFEMQFYGTASGCGVCTINASHIVVRKNKIHNMQLGVYLYWDGTDSQGNDARIEYNEIYDPDASEWPWKAVKATSMEGTGIVVSAHIGAIVRENEIHNYFNGIYTGSSAGLQTSGIAFDADIYNNNIHQIADDGLEPEGPCVNQRFRNNKVDGTLVGISLAPITMGPTWVLRSTFVNYTGSSIKWDRKSNGIVLIYHNTSWTNEKDLNAMSMISPTFNSIMRNNIFQGNGYAFEEPFTGSSGHDWNYDDWYTTRTTSAHFKWEKIAYNTITDLCSKTGLECNGTEDVPGFTNPQNGDFSLLSSSSNIDRGFLIPGINDDFAGKAPDLGANEFGYHPLPKILSIVRTDTTPTIAQEIHFRVSFSEPVSGVDAGDFALTTTGSLAGASITAVSGLKGSYTVTVNTGSGDGTIRLDLADDDSIVDEASQPLGGVGSANFTVGEVYTIVKSPKIFLQTFNSNGVNDGWIIESSEDSNRGGGYNSVSPTFYLGDNAEDKQFLTILDFSTAGLPDNAVITKATLKIKRLSVTGTDPFTTHGNVLVDIKNGSFDIPALQPSDFQSGASMESAGKILNAPVDGWYSTTLDANAFQYVNKLGNTQFRLQFELDDNDDHGADTGKFHSGEAISSNRPQLQVEFYVLDQAQLPPANRPSTSPVALSTTIAFTPIPKVQTGDRGVQWAEASFDDIAPSGINMQECWNGMGMDDQGRIYIGFTSVRSDGKQDFPLFRYTPATHERIFLGSFLEVLSATGNTYKGENVPKGHTRMVFADGRMYMGSQSFHDLKMEIDSLPTYRGSHLFSFDGIHGLWKDLSAALPGGVVTSHEGIISLNIMPEEHLLVGLAHPSSNIILYDYQAERLVKIVPGIPWKLGNPLSREVIVTPTGNIYTYRGTEAVEQRSETHSVWVYNIHTGEMKDTGFQMTNGFWIGQTRKRDGSKIYINTIAGELYEFDVATETFRDLGYELPASDKRIINYTYAITLSPDEKKLYYIPSIIQNPGGTVGNGSGGSGELFYYDIATGQIVFVQQLPIGIYTSADMRDNQNIYFAHFGNSSNIWSGNPRLFILHVPI